jgi:AcrR family transcriptional regulator
MTGLREKKKQERQERIFTAAIELIDEKGFQHTHMSDIAARAELAVGTLYNYYPSKNDLLVEIMEQQWEDIALRHRRTVIKALAEEEDPARILYRIIRPVLEDMFILSKKNWFEMMTAMFGSQKLIERGYQMDMEAIESFSSILAHLQKRGALREDLPPHEGAFTIYSIISFQFLAYLFLPAMQREDLYREIENQLRLIVEGIGADGATARPPLPRGGLSEQLSELSAQSRAAERSRERRNGE